MLPSQKRHIVLVMGCSTTLLMNFIIQKYKKIRKYEEKKVGVAGLQPNAFSFIKLLII
jgi:hypothetical protein